MSLFMEPFGGQSPKVLASTKGARVFFYGISRRLLTKGVCLHGSRDCSPHSLLVIYTLFDGPSEQLSSWCVRLMGRWVNRRPKSKSRPLLARRGLSPTRVPTASSTARSRRRGTSTMTRSDRRSCSRQPAPDEHSIAGTLAANERETIHGIALIGCVPAVLSRACASTGPAAAPAHRQNEGATGLQNKRTS